MSTIVIKAAEYPINRRLNLKKRLRMQTMKETVASVSAAAKSGMEKTKAAVGEKAYDMPTEVQKQDTGEKTTPEKPGAAAKGSYSYSTTGQEGQSTGGHQMSALPGHGTGEPAGQVVEGTTTSHPIGKVTGTGRPTTAYNTHVGGGYSG